MNISVKSVFISVSASLCRLCRRRVNIGVKTVHQCVNISVKTVCSSVYEKIQTQKSIKKQNKTKKQKTKTLVFYDSDTQYANFYQCIKISVKPVCSVICEHHYEICVFIRA